MKKYLNILPFLILAVSYSKYGANDSIRKDLNDVTSVIKKDSIKPISYVGHDNKCLAEFVKFRDYIYQQKKDSVKKYFTFPENNKSLWDLVCMQKEGTNDVLCSKQKDTFSEKDFEKYFNQLFFSQYVKCLLKLKSQELFEKGNYTTPFFIEKTADGYSLRYWIDAVFDKKTKMLELRYYIYTYEGNYLENQNDNVVGETLIEYDFKYDENCIPKFHRLIMAG